MANVENFGPFIGLNLGPRATQTWALGPFPRFFESAVAVTAHPWPQPSGSDPRHQPHLAEVDVTSAHSQITATGERFLVLTVQNIAVLPLEGYNIHVALTSGRARASAAGSMRFFVVHTPDGKISTLVGSPPGGPVMRPMQLAISELFSEVKLPARLFDPANVKTYTRLSEISATYVVEMPLRTPARLVKKTTETPATQGKLKSLIITPNPVARSQRPRFDVTLEQPTSQAVHVTLVLQLPLGLSVPLESLTIPAGETMAAVSVPIPATVPPGAYTAAAIASPNLTVTALLQITS